MRNFNEQLATWITKSVGSMWMAYVFCALALISLPAAIASHDAFVIISWISQSFLQLVLLPIIMVGQKVIGDHHQRHHKKQKLIERRIDILIEHVTGKKVPWYSREGDENEQ